MTATPSSEALSDLKYIPLSYNHADSENSARKLVTALFPEWESSEGEIQFIRFTDGITNTVRPCHATPSSYILHTPSSKGPVQPPQIQGQGQGQGHEN